MKKHLIIAIGLTALAGGCTHTYQLDNDWLATPAYSSRERFQQWQRASDLNWREMNEDIDNVLLLNPPSRMTIWDIR